MANSSYERNNFLGGERSPLAQGRSDRPDYVTALDQCLNHIPAEEGPLVRRPGTLRMVPTYGRLKAKYLKFISAAACPFVLEMTPTALRIYDGASLVFTNDAQVITNSSFSAGAITLTTTSAHGWSVGDQVQLNLAGTGDENVYRGQIFTLVAGTTGSTLVMQDDLGNPLPTPTGFVNGTTLNGATVYHVLRFTTVYSAAEIPLLRAVQATLNATILVPTEKPYVISVQDPPNKEAVFTYGALTFIDGPYLDPQTQTLTVGAVSGATTLTAGSAAFFTTDVGRAVRVFTQPALWSSASNYTTGATVTDANGEWWTAVIPSGPGSTTGVAVIPGQTVVLAGVQQLAWAPNPQAGNWAWGLITGYNSATSVNFTWDTTIPGMALQSANGLVATTWQMGVYSQTTNYPGVGAYFEGRLWLFGNNRFDASVPNGMNALAATVTYSPSDPYGNVTDASGISEVLNSKTVQSINWAEPDAQGLLVGTQSGEWLVSASITGEIITPSDIQAHQVTSVRSPYIEPIRTPMTLVFPQSYGRRVVEYLADAFSQRFASKPLNEWSRHLTPTGIVRIDYQDEPIPLLWAITGDGRVLSCTYRRVSKFITEEAAFSGWAQHRHGGGTVVDLAIVPATTGSSDRLYIEVQDAFGGFFTELVQPSVEVSPLVSVRNGWFVDSSPVPTINVPTKCGFLYPSGGYKVTAAYTPTDFGEILPPQQPLYAPGTVLPASPIALQVIDGVYFNGQSFISNLIATASMTDFSLSVWIYLAGNSGAFFNTPISGTGANAIELSSALGIVAIDKVGSGMHGIGIIPPGGALTQPVINPSGWVHLMFGRQASTNSIICYINDTKIFNAAIDGTKSYQWGSFGSANWASVTSGTSLTQASPPMSLFMFGGNAQISMPFFDPSFTSATVFNLTGSQVPAGYGLTAGVSELWMDTTYMDWSVAANRKKFHTTDLAALRYAPVNLGTRGQTPTGANPKCYLSGNPKQFRINRANKSRIYTYNNGAFGFFANNIDPAAVTLDPLPVGIGLLT